MADGSTGSSPMPDSEDAVVSAIASETGAHVDQVAMGRRRRTRRLYAIGGAAAAASWSWRWWRSGISAGRTTQGRQLAASLAPTQLAPAATGRATLTQTDSWAWSSTRSPPPARWRPLLPGVAPQRRGGPRVDRFVNEPEDVVLWAGVTPVEFRTLSVTEEVADGDPGSSGRRVLEGVAIDD